MRTKPDYQREKISVTFATSGATASDNTTTDVGLVHSILLKAHTTAETLASAASGAILSILDSDGNVIKTYTEVLTGTTTLLSADVMLFPNDTIRYAVTAKDVRCVSGASVKTTEFPTATVILYRY